MLVQFVATYLTKSQLGRNYTVGYYFINPLLFLGHKRLFIKLSNNRD